MEINYIAIGAWATVFATFVAILAILMEARRAAMGRGIDTLMKYSSEFSSDEFLDRRLMFARIAKKKIERKLNKNEQNAFIAYATFFLDHYEIIGFLLRKKMLDKQLVYVYYSSTLFSYWRFFKEVIDIYRADEPTLWEDVEWLYSELTKLFRKRVPTGNVELTDEKLKKFIATELS